MKKSLSIFFLSLCLIACDSLISSEQQWEDQINQGCDEMAGTKITVPSQFDLTEISNLDFNMGFRKLQFVTNQIGFILGGSNVGGVVKLLRSVDEGKTWEEMNIETKPRQHPRSMNFKNDKVGFITVYDASGCPDDCQNRSVLYRTIDGGDSWEEIEYNTIDGYLHHVDFDSNGNLFASLVSYSNDDSHIEIIKSENNGDTWSAFYTSDAYEVKPAFEIINDILVLPTNNGKIIKVNSEGKQLNLINTGQSHLSNLHIVSENVFFISTEAGLLRTVDAGESWDIVTEERHKIIGFTSRHEGLIIKNKFTCPTDFPLADDVIAYTNDGGNTWSESEESLNLMTSYSVNQNVTGNNFFVVIREKLYKISGS